MKKDVAAFKKVTQSIRVVGKQCFYNAFRTITDIPEYKTADYVEGIGVSNGLLIEHGWVKKDGVIVDPTLPLDEIVYFPGFRFTGTAGLLKAFRIRKPKRTREDLPIFYRFGWGGGDSPEMRAAWAAAWRYIGMEDLAKQYEREQATPRQGRELARHGQLADVRPAGRRACRPHSRMSNNPLPLRFGEGLPMFCGPSGFLVEWPRPCHAPTGSPVSP